MIAGSEEDSAADEDESVQELTSATSTSKWNEPDPEASVHSTTSHVSWDVSSFSTDATPRMSLSVIGSRSGRSHVQGTSLSLESVQSAQAKPKPPLLLTDLRRFSFLGRRLNRPDRTGRDSF